MNPTLSIELFGGLKVQVDDQTLPRIRSQKAAELLACLALHPERAHPREELIELLWEEAEPEAGRNRFKQELSGLRRYLKEHGLLESCNFTENKVFVVLCHRVLENRPFIGVLRLTMRNGGSEPPCLFSSTVMAGKR